MLRIYTERTDDVFIEPEQVDESIVNKKKHKFNAHLFECLLEQFHENSVFISVHLISLNKTSFVRNQPYGIFILLHISFTMHRNFRRWHQLFYNRSGPYKIHALPISNVLVHRFQGTTDYLEIAFDRI